MSNDRKKAVAEITWQEIQDEIAAESGVAVVTVQGRYSTIISESNNNSICRTLQPSAEFGHLCERYCGQAYTQGLEQGRPTCFRCHAGLTYVTVPVEIEKGKNLVAIVGRAFTRSADYMSATEKARSGEWKELPPETFLDNILLASSADEIEDAAKRLQHLSDEEKFSLDLTEREFHGDNAVLDISPAAKEKKYREIITITSEIPIKTEPKKTGSISDLVKQFNKQEAKSEGSAPIIEGPIAKPSQKAIDKPTPRKMDSTEEALAWRSLFNSLLQMNYHQACVLVLKFLARKYEFRALAWLESKNGHLETYLVGGSFKGQQLRINLPISDSRLVESINRESALELHEQSGEGDPRGISKVLLFPLVVGGELRSALVVGDGHVSDDKRRSLSRFCRQVSVSLEILRLRDEIGRQTWLTRAIKKFNEGLTKLDTNEFWPFIARASADLLQAELGSLLLYNEEDSSLTATAAVGKDVKVLNSRQEEVGKRIADRVLKNGKPIVVTDVANTGLPPAPAERRYKTRSFLSYPIVFGSQKIGVLNMTDKVDGSVYDEYDLELLNAVTPQLAVAFDRASLERKAGEYEQLSITDSLTGLLNRRYLEERMSEEMTRSRRYGYQMSFMMIDVDEFKSYNDTYLHTAGDKVLQILAHRMKDGLRGADVAARYGGEEFSILLPQTSLSEAKVIAERLREKIANTDFPNRRVTISIGVAAFDSQIAVPEELIALADKALYQAKDNGRNNVQAHQGLPHTQS
jgi:diguanylate cyclase (GGDEF)-like protein